MIDLWNTYWIYIIVLMSKYVASIFIFRYSLFNLISIICLMVSIVHYGWIITFMVFFVFFSVLVFLFSFLEFGEYYTRHYCFSSWFQIRRHKKDCQLLVIESMTSSNLSYRHRKLQHNCMNICCNKQFVTITVIHNWKLTISLPQLESFVSLELLDTSDRLDIDMWHNWKSAFLLSSTIVHLSLNTRYFHHTLEEDPEN